AVFSDAASSVANSAADLYGKTAESARAAAENARGAAGSVASFLKEEPLVLAGIGLALGALLGAAFPETEAENKLMGRQSDALKERAAKAAGIVYLTYCATHDMAVAQGDWPWHSLASTPM